MGKVFITRTFPFDALARLRAEHDVDVWDDNAPPPRDALLERAADADALLTIITEKVDAELFDAAPASRPSPTSPSGPTTSTSTRPSGAGSPSATRPAC